MFCNLSGASQNQFIVELPWGGGYTHTIKLYRDMPPFRVWLFDCLLINRVSNSKIFYKQGLKILYFDEKMSGV